MRSQSVHTSSQAGKTCPEARSGWGARDSLSTGLPCCSSSFSTSCFVSVRYPYHFHHAAWGIEKSLYGFEDDIMLTKLYLMGKHSIRLPNHQIDNELQQRYPGRRAGFNNNVVVCACTKEVSRSETERVVS